MQKSLLTGEKEEKKSLTGVQANWTVYNKNFTSKWSYERLEDAHLICAHLNIECQVLLLKPHESLAYLLHS